MSNLNAYLNGDYLNIAEAKVSVMDRGFLFGDGVYEVIPVYRRRFFHWDLHLQRLEKSLAAIHLPFDAAALAAPAEKLIASQAEDEQALYIQITRGVYPQRQQKPLAGVPPTVFMMSTPRAAPPPEKLRDGIRCVSIEDFRWQRCDIKAISLLATVMIADKAVRRGADEAILLREGVLSEASSANYILVKDQTLITPLQDHRILAGVTYRVILQLAEAAGYAVQRRNIAADEIYAADELWLSSSLNEMVPVASVDGKAIGGGTPGPVFKEMYAIWRKHTAGE